VYHIDDTLYDNRNYVQNIAPSDKTSRPDDSLLSEGLDRDEGNYSYDRYRVSYSYSLYIHHANTSILLSYVLQDTAISTLRTPSVGENRTLYLFLYAPIMHPGFFLKKVLTAQRV